MDDELRRLEREAARGDPAAVQRLAVARFRAQAQEGLWEQFDYLFDLLEQRPWDQALIASMEKLCERMPTTPPTELQTARENLVIEDGDHVIWPNRVTRMVIKGGRFNGPPRPSPVRTLGNSRRVIIFAGRFDHMILDGSDHVIILGGIFISPGNIDHLTVIDGVFESLEPGVKGIVIGGRVKVLVPAPDTIAIGGDFEGIMWPVNCAAQVWLPKHILGHISVPFHARVVAAVLDIGRFSRTRDEQAIRDSQGAVFVRACPVLEVPPGHAQMEIMDLTYSAPQKYLYDLLPFLRSDNRINRNNLAAWIEAQFKRLKQVGTPCFPQH